MHGFHYVYTLESVRIPGRHYVGLTEDLSERLRRHNLGEVRHTSAFTPWQIISAVAFRNRERAAAFEKYLKSAAGRAFARKRL